MLLGITGTDGAGKGFAVEYLVAEKGFVHYSARAIWIEELTKRGVEATRRNMRLVANELRKLHGNDYSVVHALQKIAAEKPKHAAIESIRTTAEAETLTKNGGILIAIDADQKIRYARVQERRSETDKVSFEEFVAHEALEANDPDPHGMQKQKVIDMAEYRILNDGNITDFYTEIDKMLEALGFEN